MDTVHNSTLRLAAGILKNVVISKFLVVKQTAEAPGAATNVAVGIKACNFFSVNKEFPASANQLMLLLLFLIFGYVG
jgi:hypothetical protein